MAEFVPIDSQLVEPRVHRYFNDAKVTLVPLDSSRAFLERQEIHLPDRMLRYRRMRLLVELSCSSRGAFSASSSGMMRCASAFPSSTPHWSKELMLQRAPCVKTLCS